MSQPVTPADASLTDSPAESVAESEASNNSRPAKRGIREGLWLKCPSCGKTVFRKQVDKLLGICPECDHHFYVSARTRIEQLLDEASFEEWFQEVLPLDPLKFVDSKPYAKRLASEQKKTGLTDACVAGRGYLRGRPLVIAVTDSQFIMGSMGSVMGEVLTRCVERATELRLPLIIVSGSGGGARMHEGILSLMQMAKVSAALAKYHEAGGLYISVLTDPTMGGVAASFASLGDLVIAEAKSRIGFAGPRVIAATVKQPLPEGFQTSEFLLEHGFVDRIIHRSHLRAEIASIIDYCEMKP